MTDVQKIPLRQTHVAILACRDNLSAVNSGEAESRERLPVEQAILADLQRNITANAPDAGMLRIVAQEIRVRVLNDCIISAATKREGLTRQLQGHLARLNWLLESVGIGEKHFLSGPRPEKNADAALQAIERILKP